MDDEVRNIFNKFDKNGDGRISVSELEEMLSTFGSKTSSEELKRMMEPIDQNGDGYIDLKELTDFHCNNAAAGTDDELRYAFDLYDLDKYGFISPEELHIVLNKLGEKCSLSDCQRMISNVHADGDGKVNFEAFKKMMAR
jgi:calcium-binding protein CML